MSYVIQQKESESRSRCDTSSMNVGLGELTKSIVSSISSTGMTSSYFKPDSITESDCRLVGAGEDSCVVGPVGIEPTTEGL